MRSNPVRPGRLLGALLLLTAFGSFATIAPASAAAKNQHVASQVIPVPPAGWHPPNRPARPWLDRHATAWVQTLSPADCAQLNAEHPRAAPNCKVRDYFLKTGGSHQPLPAGTRFTGGSDTNSAFSPPYYQWGWYSYVQCSYLLGCNGWNVNMQIYGVANDVHVYQWYHYCTPGGNLVDNTVTWCGYLYNGGTYNSQVGCNAMQFGDDNKATETLPGGSTVTGESGQRVWVSCEGVAFDYWTFGGRP